MNYQESIKKHGYTRDNCLRMRCKPFLGAPAGEYRLHIISGYILAIHPDTMMLRPANLTGQQVARLFRMAGMMAGM